MRQHPLPREILLVGDGSTDDSVDIVRAVPLPIEVSLQVVREKGAGSARARDRGAAEAKNNGLLFLDADDEVSRNVVGELLARAGSSNVVQGDVVITSEAGTDVDLRSMAPDTLHPSARELFKPPWWRVAWDGAHDEVDEFFYFSRLAANGARIRHVNHSILKYREHQSVNRKSNLAYDYGTALTTAFAVLWNEHELRGSEDVRLGSNSAWIMADVCLRSRSRHAKEFVRGYAVKLRPLRWRSFGFALRHYGLRRVLRLLWSWPRSSGGGIAHKRDSGIGN